MVNSGLMIISGLMLVLVSNGHFRYLNWRYCTLCVAIFCGDMPSSYKALCMVGTSTSGS